MVMDRGIDYRHPDFINSNGKTRIAYIFDLYDNTGANDPDNPYGVGTIYDSTEINAALQAGGAPITNDWYGHGTATTGIMAGNGSAVSNAQDFRGVAYNSRIISIIVTKDFFPPFGGNPGQTGQFNADLIPVGLRFARDKINELGLPAVTLLNIGSIGDPTDGSISLCDSITAFVNNGNTFVCGVGDDGGNDNHEMKTFTLNQTETFEIAKAEQGNLRFTLWYSEDDRLQFNIERPNGVVEGPFLPPAGRSDAKDTLISQMNIYHRGADVEFARSSSNIRQLLIDFYGDTGTYKLSFLPTQVNSSGKSNAFLNPSRFSNNNRFLNISNPGGNINSYSSCHATLSPGDYVATNSYTDINGVQRNRTGQGAPGEIWTGSSKGPTMDGRFGIDLTSPGEIATAAYGAGSYYSNFAFNILENSQGYYGIQTAVSAAAPIVSGVIALMLELDPTLSPSEIKTILQQSSRADSFTGTTPNNTWGYGKLDALAAIEEVFKAELPDPSLSESQFYPNPVRDNLHIEVMGMEENKYRVKIYSVQGIKVLDQMSNNNEDLNLSHLNKGVYILEVSYNRHLINHRIIKH